MLVAKKDGNKCHIEGILSEINLEKASFKKDGADVPCIRGDIKVRVEQKLPNGEVDLMEIPLYIFASQYTKAGTVNPAYVSAEKVLNEFKSIAAVGIENADCVRVTSGTITNNEYYDTRTSQFRSYPRISVSFIDRINRSEMVPSATFKAIFYVGATAFATDTDGVEDPNRFLVKGILPKFGGKIDIVTFVVQNPKAISVIEKGWATGNTVVCQGRLHFTSEVSEKITEVDFGEPIVERVTHTVSDLIITAGSGTPLDEEMGYNSNDIQTAMSEHQAYLHTLKDKALAKNNSVTTTSVMDSLGF